MKKLNLVPENDLISRINTPKMLFYRTIYKKSIRWDGKQSLVNKKLIVYCEQGLGDSIQFMRYIPHLKKMGCYLIVHSHVELHRLMLHMGADEVADKDSPNIPKHDLHVLSMSLPFLLGFISTKPYIKIAESVDTKLDGTKVGIAWEGNPSHTNNLERSCSLKHFSKLGNVHLFKLQKYIYLWQLQHDSNLNLYGMGVNDFYDTAKLINAMDYVVTVDTSILHLSAAMGKKTYGLLSYNHDHRWDVCKWYDSLTLLTQNTFNDWDSVFDKLVCKLTGKKYIHKKVKTVDKKILITGGIGDFFILESCFTKEQRLGLEKIYLATRAYKALIPLIEKHYPSVEICVLTTDFDEKFAYYSKADCRSLNLPSDWGEVVDWSIAVKFPHIQKGLIKVRKSSLLKKGKLSLELPEKFAVIVNNSPNDMRDKKRVITRVEWKRVISYLEKNNMKGIVLNIGNGFVPKHNSIINLTNKTSLLESIQILLRSKAYLGVDSCLSVLAAQLDIDLHIKSNNGHLYNHLDVYYANCSSDCVKPILL